jgi:hypothetical protein
MKKNIQINEQQEELVNEKNSYKLAFETVTDVLKKYSKETDDGSLILNVIMEAATMEDDGEDSVGLDAFMLIEQALSSEDLVKMEQNNPYEQARNELIELLPNHLRVRFKDLSFIAGGCIYSLHNNEIPNDYDFFLTDKKYAQVLKDYFGDLELDNINGVKKGIYKDLPLVVTDNAISVGKYQVITQWVGSIDEVVSEFDFKHNQFYYHDGEIGTLSNFKYLDDNKLRYNEERARNLVHSFIRTVKFVERGFTISHREMAKMILKLNEVGLSAQEKDYLTSLTGGSQENDTYSNNNSEDENYSEE